MSSEVAPQGLGVCDKGWICQSCRQAAWSRENGRRFSLCDTEANCWGLARPRVTTEGKALGIGEALCDVRVKWWVGEAWAVLWRRLRILHLILKFKGVFGGCVRPE